MENIREWNDSILTNQERDKILYDLFRWGEWSLDSSFLYKWKWAELYADISSDKTYPFIDIEISCLEKLKHNHKFKKILDKTEFITDVWSWDGQKAVALLWWTNWKWTYLAEDYSRQMLSIAEDRVKNSAPQIKLWSSQKLNGQSHLSSQCPNNMYLFLWGTICNMTDEEIVNELRTMDNNWFIDWNDILLSYFTAPQTQEGIDDLIKIYNSESNRAFHENWMDMLWLSRNDFEFDTIYEKDDPKQMEWPFPWKIKWIIRAKKDSIVKLSDWKEIPIKQWQEFTIHYSRRFSKKWIEDLFNKSGCNVVFTVDNEWDSIVLLKRKPMLVKKFLNRNRTSLFIALAVWALGAWTRIGSALNEKKQKEKEEERIEQERRDYWQDYQRDTHDDVKQPYCLTEADFMSTYQEEQSNILLAEYNISSLNETRDSFDKDCYIVWNKIVDMYRDEFSAHYRDGKTLSAERFMELYWWQIIDKYHIPYQKPYEHFKNYKNVIENTIKYWNSLDLSKYKVEEISTESELSYFIKGKDWQDGKDSHHRYRLKIVRVHLDNWKTIDLFVGEQNQWYWMQSKKQWDYNLETWVKCMKDLTENYWSILE